MTNDGHAQSPRTLRVAAVQMESRPGDKAANFAKIEAFVRQAARQSVRLIVFPECCITGYWFIRNLTPEGLAALAEPVFRGESTQRLISLANQYGLSIGAGLLEAGENGAYHNTYVVTMPSG
jgi:predicted amidohydrolase